MITSLLNELNDGEDKKRKETVISGVAAAAYTGERLRKIPLQGTI